MCDLKQYIAEHYLDVYLEDAINKIMNPENKVDNIDEFLKEYFRQVNTGEHINNADGKYLLASPYNRACVVRQLIRTLEPFRELGSDLSKGDYCSIIEVTWPLWDSRMFVQKSIMRFLDRSQMCYPIDDFIRAFSLSIFYEDFLREADKILLSNKTYSRNRVLYKLKDRRQQITDCKSLWPDHQIIEDCVGEDCSYGGFNSLLFEISNKDGFINELCEAAG